MIYFLRWTWTEAGAKSVIGRCEREIYLASKLSFLADVNFRTSFENIEDGLF